MSRAPAHQRITDTALTALAPLIWGSTYIVTTELLPPGLPMTAACIRTLPAGLLLVLLCRQLPARGDWLRLLILALLNIGAFQALLFVAAYRLPGGLGAVIGATQPLLVMGLAWGVGKQVPALSGVAASLIGVAGMAALLLAPGLRFDGTGIAAAAAGALCMGCGTFLTRRWRLSLSVLSLTGWQLLLGGLMLMPLVFLLDPPLPHLSATQWAAYAYLSLFGSLLAYGLWFRGVKRLSPVAVSSLGLLSPLAAVLLGWALLNQALRGQALAGLAVVLLSVLAVQLSAAR
ncbi:DMT family transporter [Paucibacter sp. Y2R2-4]|uniref:DMT family transporter n=1 Tax=Paucibacter sp. Y2R2-4 TaxID=2893553 RepID=UPI0021E3DCB6|nr:DMT family transporter [Paucibacter sp. Y2R2-4]MCV2350538.1 DMT family transporter [Paucibacter sp. Y2R2-4]